jgi:hypothetical protein
VDQKPDSHKVLKISLDVSVPVDAEVYQILSGFSSALERKNYLQSAVLYYARSPLVLTSNALVDRLSEIRVDEFSEVHKKLDAIAEAVHSIRFVPVVDNAQGVDGSQPLGDGVVSSGSLLGEDTKAALLSLRQKFKV